MSAAIRKVTSLPAALEPNSLYLVGDGTTDAEAFITSNTGAAVGFGNTAFVNALINTALSAQSNFEVVADIAARDALTPASSVLVLVTDASADATVDSGAAMYAWDGTAWSKVTEFESLDVNITWSSITDGPASTPTLVDLAVSQTHVHTNSTELDKIGEDADGCLTFDNVPYVSSPQLDW